MQKLWINHKIEETEQTRKVKTRKGVRTKNTFVSNNVCETCADTGLTFIKHI